MSERWHRGILVKAAHRYAKPKRTGYRVHPCPCGSNRLPVRRDGFTGLADRCPDCGCLAPSDGQVVVAWR